MKIFFVPAKKSAAEKIRINTVVNGGLTVPIYVYSEDDIKNVVEEVASYKKPVHDGSPVENVVIYLDKEENIELLIDSISLDVLFGYDEIFLLLVDCFTNDFAPDVRSRLHKKKGRYLSILPMPERVFAKHTKEDGDSPVLNMSSILDIIEFLDYNYLNNLSYLF